MTDPKRNYRSNFNTDEKPLVSICSITYNHENYIRDCLDGFLIQKTTFSIEIIIHDDASTDKTADIIMEYTEKYPDLFTTILQKENKYSQGIKPIIEYVYPKARGKYIAICEGDDYWTDPLKLQKQVEFMEVNEDCSLCFHAAEHICEDDPEKNFIKRPDNVQPNIKFTVKDAILGDGGFITTNSMLFKTKYLNNIPAWVTDAPIGDYPLMLLLSHYGKIGYIDVCMSVYRRNVNNSWTKRRSFQDIIKHEKGVVNLLNAYNLYTGKSYNSEINKMKTLHYLVIIKNYIKIIIMYKNK